MPALGADMDAGTVTEWRVRAGEAVHRGDVVMVVETEKATLEAEIWENGVVEQILVPEGTKVPVGTVLATIRTEAAVPEAPAVPAAPAPEPVLAGAAPGARAPAAGPPEAQRRRVSPMARRLAEELGLHLSAIAGTGAGGAVTEADVRRAAGAAPPAPAPSPPAPSRRQALMDAIATLMARSKREIPHYYLATDIDMTRALRWLEAENAKRPVAARLLPAALLFKAVALAARQAPEMNGFWADGRFQHSEAVHVGVAISLRQGGLLAPALHDADRKSLDEIMLGLLDLGERARSGGLRASEMADPTITVTNLGERGVDAVFGVIYPPQVALVGFGRVLERPWASDGMVGARPVVTATLSGDHRVSDGHRGSRFLAAVTALLQEPEKL
jgi:pyruvate dehydrogenase E2 component (dihydrolipoamide acetyltransferase)